MAVFLDVPAARCLKTLLVQGENDTVVALIVRGDHELNAVKAQEATRRHSNPCAWRASNQQVRRAGGFPSLACHRTARAAT